MTNEITTSVASSAASAKSGAADASGSLWLAVYTLTRRELVRFFRQRTRVIGAVGQPIVFWILFGAGLRSSFQSPDWAEGLSSGISYQEYFFPGIAVLIVLFTAIFSTISIIEDRREGFLQGVLVSPVSRLSIVLGKLCGGSLLAVIQAGLFLLIGPLLAAIGFAPSMQVEFGLVGCVSGFLLLVLIALQLTALGYVIAWPMKSTQGFHAIMSIFLMPMWLLSGSFFPGGGNDWLGSVIRGNPLTYGVAGLRRLLYSGVDLPVTPTLPGLGLCLLVTIVTTIVYIAVAVWMTNRRSVINTR